MVHDHTQAHTHPLTATSANCWGASGFAWTVTNGRKTQLLPGGVPPELHFRGTTWLTRAGPPPLEARSRGGRGKGWRSQIAALLCNHYRRRGNTAPWERHARNYSLIQGPRLQEAAPAPREACAPLLGDAWLATEKTGISMNARWPGPFGSTVAPSRNAPHGCETERNVSVCPGGTSPRVSRSGKRSKVDKMCVTCAFKEDGAIS